MDEQANSTPKVDDGAIDHGTDNPSADDLLARHLASSEFLADENAEDLPEVPEVEATEEVDEDEDLDESTDADQELDEDEDPEGEEAEGEDETDEESTQDTPVYTLDELEDFQVVVKINGEETPVNVSELVKGYATDQSLSKKGREQSEAIKQQEEALKAKEAEVLNNAEAVNVFLQERENKFSQAYHNIEAKIEAARKSGDTYEVSKLKDQREQAQKAYWDARQKREGVQEAARKHKEQETVQQHSKAIEYFNEKINDFVPNFDQEVAKDIRVFALEEGIPGELLDAVTSPEAIGALFNFMQLKKGVKKGTAKRKGTPVKRAAPTKKAKPRKVKDAEKQNAVRNRALSPDSSEADQMAFLRQHASKSLNL